MTKKCVFTLIIGKIFDVSHKLLTTQLMCVQTGMQTKLSLITTKGARMAWGAKVATAGKKVSTIPTCLKLSSVLKVIALRFFALFSTIQKNKSNTENTTSKFSHAAVLLISLRPITLISSCLLKLLVIPVSKKIHYKQLKRIWAMICSSTAFHTLKLTKKTLWQVSNQIQVSALKNTSVSILKALILILKVQISRLRRQRLQNSFKLRLKIT